MSKKLVEQGAMACDHFASFVRYWYSPFAIEILNWTLVFSWQDILRTIFYADQKTAPSKDHDFPHFGPAKAFAVAQFASTVDYLVPDNVGPHPNATG